MPYKLGELWDLKESQNMNIKPQGENGLQEIKETTRRSKRTSRDQVGKTHLVMTEWVFPTWSQIVLLLLWLVSLISCNPFYLWGSMSYLVTLLGPMTFQVCRAYQLLPTLLAGSSGWKSIMSCKLFEHYFSFSRFIFCTSFWGCSLCAFEFLGSCAFQFLCRSTR